MDVDERGDAPERSADTGVRKRARDSVEEHGGGQDAAQRSLAPRLSASIFSWIKKSFVGRLEGLLASYLHAVRSPGDCRHQPPPAHPSPPSPQSGVTHVGVGGWQPVELLCAVSIGQQLRNGAWRCGLSGVLMDKEDLESKPESSNARAWRRPASNELLVQVSPDDAPVELLALRDPRPSAVGERDVRVPLATDPAGDVALCLLYLCFEAPAPRDAFVQACSPA